MPWVFNFLNKFKKCIIWVKKVKYVLAYKQSVTYRWLTLLKIHTEAVLLCSLLWSIFKKVMGLTWMKYLCTYSYFMFNANEYLLLTFTNCYLYLCSR